MNQKYLNSIRGWAGRHWLLLVLIFLPGITLLFLVEERLRGRILLARYVRRLEAQGEKMNPRDFALPRIPGENGAPEVLALAKGLSPGSVIPNSGPPRMRLTPAGNAIVGFREEQWVDGKITNRWEQLAQDLESHQDTLDHIQSALTKPVLDCEFDLTLGPRAPLTHLPAPKTLAQWFGPRVALGLHEGEMRETLKDLLTEIELPRILARDGILISELVRCAVASIARIDTWEALQADGWTDGDLAQIQEAWERQHFAVPMVRALEGERIFAQTTYLLMRKSNRETVGILYGLQDLMGEERPSWEQSLRQVAGGQAVADFLKKEIYCRLWRFAWLDQDHLLYLRNLEQLIGLSRDASRDKSLKKVQPLVDDLISKSQNRAFYNRLRYPSVMSIDSLSRVLSRAMRSETERSLVVVAVALKRYKLRHGRMAQSLSELVPEFVQAVPVDYMDGQPLRLRVQPGDGFLLYSVGENGQDDGGDAGLIPGKTGPRVPWNRKDVVWPQPATEAEVEAYHADPAN